MKVISLFLLMTCFNCSIYNLQKYDTTPKIRDSYGFVVLNLDKFQIGEKIYITINSYENEYYDYIYYNFSDIYPLSDDQNMPINYIKAYSSDYKTYERNVSDGYGGYYIYYVYDYYYYFEFEKTNNARLLVIEYNLRSSSASYLIFDNTGKGKYDEPSDTPGNNPEKDPNYTTIIVVSSVVGFIVIVAVLFLVIKYRNKFPCCHKIDSNDIISSNNKEQDKFLE